MPLQNILPPGTQTIVMVGLGVRKDRPPNNIQPKLEDGIHLRWSIRGDVGFPWHGFYLFRRPHTAGDRICLSDLTAGRMEGQLADFTLGSNQGTVTSDAALILTNDFPREHRQPGRLEFDLRGRTYISFVPSVEISWVEIKLGFYAEGTIALTALLRGNPVDEQEVTRGPNDIVTVHLQFDVITEVRISSGPAALIDLCYVTVKDQSIRGWDVIRGLDYPIRLPVTHRDYPSTPGQNEDLDDARTIAARRVQYGSPDPFVDTTAVPAAGTVDLAHGSPIVGGNGTDWTAKLTGAIFRVQGDRTAYTILAVVSTTRLILSRAYGGVAANGAAYRIRRDPFGQLHDCLVHLVAGGPAAGAMARRTLPEPIERAGQVSLIENSPVVTGIGTGWADSLAGLTFRVMGPSAGTVTLSASIIVAGSGTQWDSGLVGFKFAVVGDNVDYTIVRVLSRMRLELDRPYEGVIPSGRVNCTISDFASYTILAVDEVSQELTLDRAYQHTNAPGRPYVISAILQASQPGGMGPVMPWQSPLQLMLMASLNPAMAQILGLYFIDKSAVRGTLYDYLIVIDPQGIGKNNARAVLNELAGPGGNGFANLDGYISFNLSVGDAAPLSPPDDVRVYALPPNPVPDVNRGGAANMAGLRWDLGRTNHDEGVLRPGQAVMYHLWRAYLGNDDNPPNRRRYALVTKGRPLLVTEPVLRSIIAPPSPPDWPPLRLHAIDSGLRDGWYSYQVTGIDIFGRHSDESLPASWYEWVPQPIPRPWYYVDPPADKEITPNGVQGAVRLLNRMPPPPPTGLEAHALDPGDRTVVQDAAYVHWRQGLAQEIRDTLIGLRVRWLWTRGHMLQAPDTNEFRIYYQPDRVNALLGQTGAVARVNDSESTVDTDILNDQDADAYVGAEIRIGSESFPIVGSRAGAPLQVQVRRGPSYDTGTVEVTNNSPRITGFGTNWDRRLSGLDLIIDGDPANYVIVRVDSPTALTLNQPCISQSGTGKNYRISGRQPRAGAQCTVVIPPAHPLFKDYTAASNWLERYHVVDYAEHEVVDGARYERVTAQVLAMKDAAGRELRGAGAAIIDDTITLDGGQDLSDPDLIGSPLILQDDQHMVGREYGYLIRSVDTVARTVTIDGLPNVANARSPWIIGSPLRTYEVFLPAPHTAEGEAFAPTLASTVVYAQIGVSAADNDVSVADDRIWSDDGRGGNGQRSGNEGRVAGPATIFRVRRTPPDPPEIPRFESERVYATAADYHSHSYYTLRWVKSGSVKTHIFRALDDAVFQADWKWRRSLIGQAAAPPPFVISPVNAADEKYFPPEWLGNDLAKQARRAAVINGVDGTPGLNDLNNLNPAAGFNEVRATYRRLKDDALRVLAGLPRVQPAFTQLTIQPLDPNEPDPEDAAELRWRNRRSPDDPDNFVVDDPNNPLASHEWRIYPDTLDGRSLSRYFYRTGYVDGAHNRSTDLSLSTPPVYLPKVTPPRAPVITKVLGGDRKITITWASSREPDLLEYRVYRTQNVEALRDIRLMSRAPNGVIAAGNLAARPAEVEWIDMGIVAAVTYRYRVVAVDTEGNVSVASPPVAGRAFDESRPQSPPWLPAEADVAPNSMILRWAPPARDLNCLVQRKVSNAGDWSNISAWLGRGVYTFTDTTRAPQQTYDYRLRVIDREGRLNRDLNILTV